KLTQVGIRSLSPEEARAIPSLPTSVFYDFSMRKDPDWIDRVVDSLGETVYISIDVDGMDPAIMPATGTPEPGGLSWYELLALLRRTIEKRKVVGCDVVELAPMAGNVAPNFLCAKLVYKILSYRFGSEVGRSAKASRS
ncbi:MAG TPA: arginase family protein, partial [Vicinamibacterales bacterium]|nr:arginase family protein [Vicinamibacterales bacterium]